MKNLSNEIAEHSIGMFEARLKNLNQDGVFLVKDQLKELLNIHLREMNICLQRIGYSAWSQEERWQELFKVYTDFYEDEYINYELPDLDSEHYY